MCPGDRPFLAALDARVGRFYRIVPKFRVDRTDRNVLGQKPVIGTAGDRGPPRSRSMRGCCPFRAAWRDPSAPPRIHLPPLVVPCLGRLATNRPSANTSIAVARAPPEPPAPVHPLRTRLRWVSLPCPRPGPFQPTGTRQKIIGFLAKWHSTSDAGGWIIGPRRGGA